MHTRYKQLVVAFVVFVATNNAISEEITSFKLTNFDGDFVLRYLYDEQTQTSSGVETLSDARPTFQEELKLSTSSYIYHPNLLKMDISGSLLLDQSSNESIGSESSNESELVNFNSIFNFLEKKPYPITLYYNQQNPSTTAGETGRFIQENIRYGIDVAIMKPVSPVLISLKAYRQTLEGEGADQVVDDEKKQASVRFYLANTPGSHMELTHEESQLISNSGSSSSNLTIDERVVDRRQTVFSSQDVFGVNNEIKFTTDLSRKIQDQYPVTDELIFAPALSWKHNNNLDSFYRMNYTDLTEESFESHLKKIDAGLNHHTNTMNTGVSLQGEDNETTKVDSTLSGLKFQYAYKKPLTIGEFKFNFNSVYDVRDQVSNVAFNLAEVFGESHILDGITLVTLGRDDIVKNSIVVSNESRTQIFVEDVDYRITVLGVKTRIERLIGGSILNGQVVLVDYSYNTGGTFAYDMAINNMNINWAISNSYDVYLRYSDTDINLQEGSPSIALNSVTSFTAGISVNKSLNNGIQIGGELYQENRKEDINPYLKQNIDAFVELPLPQLTSLRLSARRSIQDYDEPGDDNDNDTKDLTIRIKSRPWLRGNMSWESSYKSDITGMNKRLMLRHRLRLSWKLRQLALSASINFQKEQQELNIQESWDARFTASRKF